VYEKSLVPAMLGPMAAELIEAAELCPEERILDVACGTGIVARLAAQRVGAKGRVFGIDLNSSMLNVARSILPPEGAPAEWLQGSALTLPFSSSHFNVVLCHQGLQYFPDRAMVLREMYRTLVQGGRLVVGTVTNIERNPVHARLAELLECHVGSNAAEILLAGFGLGSADVLHTLITGAGFQEVTVRPVVVSVQFPSAEEFVRRQVAGSPLAGPVGRVKETARAALLREACDAFQSYVTEAGLRFPIETNHAVAVR
jgi:SAM-dependent methyltransferase